MMEPILEWVWFTIPVFTVIREEQCNLNCHFISKRWKLLKSLPHVRRYVAVIRTQGDEVVVRH